MMRCFCAASREKQYVPFFYFIVLKMEELWHYNDFLGKRIICRGVARGGQLQFLQSNLCVLKYRSICISHAGKAWGKKKV